MAKSPSTKFFTNSDVGAPALNISPGSLIALLDACLVTGYNVRTALSAAASSGVMTLTYAVAHGYAVHRVIKVSGAAIPAANGEHRVISVTATTVQVEVAGLSDGAVGGTIETRIAPLGWEKQFAGTNVAVYRRPDITATTHVIRIDDTGSAFSGARGGGNVRVQCAKSATSVDTLVDEWFPGTAAYWGKVRSGASPRWVVVGDSRAFYLIPSVDPDYPNGRAPLYVFGDLRSFKVGDQFACTVHYHIYDDAAGQPGWPSWSNYGDPTGRAIARSVTGIGNAVTGALLGAPGTFDAAGLYVYPDATGGLHLWPLIALQNGAYNSSTGQLAHTLRGELPGALVSNQTLNAVFFTPTVVEGVLGIGGSGSDVLFVPIGEESNFRRMIAFTLSTPWF